MNAGNCPELAGIFYICARIQRATSYYRCACWKEDLHTQSGIKIDLQEPHYKYGDFVSWCFNSGDSFKEDKVKIQSTLATHSTHILQGFFSLRFCFQFFNIGSLNSSYTSQTCFSFFRKPVFSQHPSESMYLSG